MQHTQDTIEQKIYKFSKKYSQNKSDQDKIVVKPGFGGVPLRPLDRSWEFDQQKDSFFAVSLKSK